MRRLTIGVALLLTALNYPAFSQSRSDHEAHHPGADQVPAPSQTTPPAGRSGERQGMMGGGDMMGRGTKGRSMMGEDARASDDVPHDVCAYGRRATEQSHWQEFQAAHERIFKAMDSNKDGQVTQEEMQAFMHGTRK